MLHLKFPIKLIGFLTVALYSLIANATDEHHHDDDFEHTQHRAHDHGKVVATLSYSQNQINLHLMLPAYNAFGFEHAPNNKQQQALVESTLETLSQASNVVEFQPSCIVDSVNIADSHEDTSNTTDEHFDVKIEYIFTCPSSEARSVSFSLFETISSINQIEVQYISDTEQKLVTLDVENHAITID